jgi:hypothetical protein
LKRCFYPRCIGTFVQRGSMFCFVVLVLVLVLADTLLRILHFCPISPCFQHITPLHAPLPCRLARQPCPAALPGSLARQPCPAALPSSLARQPCLAALPGSLAWKPCPTASPAALPGSLVRQPCLAVQPCPAALHSSHKFRLVLLAEFHHAMKLVAF